MSTGSVDAASGNSIQNVKSLQQGDTTLEGAKIGEPVQNLLKSNDVSVYHTDRMAKNIIMNLKR